MLILVIAEDTELKSRFDSFFGVLGYSVVQYTHPLKALDNLDELNPDVLVCSSTDYPRHWKLIVKELRDCQRREDTAIILTVGEYFDDQEADKAAFLGVNVLYPERLETIDDFRHLQDRIVRYKAPPERTGVFNWIPDDKTRISFIFRHPNDYRMIAGRFTEISPAGGVFRPDEPEEIEGLLVGTIIREASMRAGDSILTVDARIIRNQGVLSMAFTDFDGDGFQQLLDEMNLHVVSI